MLRQVYRAVPPTWTVIVLADLGLYARWLFRRITRLGWHPFLRINNGGTFRPTGERQGVPLKTLVPQPGSQWSGTGVAFKGRQRRLRCTLLARWEPGYQDPWLILTDLPPAVGEVCWYGLRAWIEQGFKRTKRGGWQWQQTPMTDPRGRRAWLAIAVATLWLVSVGGEADAALPATTLPDLATVLPPPPRSIRRPTCAWSACFGAAGTSSWRRYSTRPRCLADAWFPNRGRLHRRDTSRGLSHPLWRCCKRPEPRSARYSKSYE